MSQTASTGSEVRASFPGRTPSYSLRSRSRLWAMAGLGALLIALVIATAAIGSTKISVGTVYQIMLHHLPFAGGEAAWSDTAQKIVMDIRLPRIFMAALVGVALALAGATYQGLFRNPLADPYLIGVAQGAALGAVVGFLLPVSMGMLGLGVVPVTAFAGGLAGAMVSYLLARVGKTLPVTTLILAGVAVGAFFASISAYLMVASSEHFRGALSFLLGGFYLSSWDEVRLMAPYVAVGAGVILAHGRQLNVMQFDEEQAQQMGIRVERVKLILLAAATLATAAGVSFAGTIGFVGIMVPHAVRLIWGPDYRYLLPLSALAGAIFMVLADALVRALGAWSPALSELPVGVITAFLGAPFFLYVLRQKKRWVF